nr:hypothetical protein [Tanacetum cinerariifolium]
ETYGNTTTEKHAYIDPEAKVLHMILKGIEDDIYSTMDACTRAKEMWIAIERLHQECRKPKRAKDYSYHKEKMMLCKKEEKSVPLSADHDKWLHDTDEEPDE